MSTTKGTRPIDANNLARKIREYMDDFPNATTRLVTCRVILSMLGDENQTPTLRPITREQVAEVWKGCDLCLDDSWQRILMIPKRFDHTNMLSTELAQFCPGCGRPLTDKAVDMVMERLEALYGEAKAD